MAIPIMPTAPTRNAGKKSGKEVFMNDVINCILERRSIRKYKSEQITKAELDIILQAGLYAPNAGGRQSSFMVVC